MAENLRPLFHSFNAVLFIFCIHFATVFFSRYKIGPGYEIFSVSQIVLFTIAVQMGCSDIRTHLEIQEISNFVILSPAGFLLCTFFRTVTACLSHLIGVREREMAVEKCNTATGTIIFVSTNVFKEKFYCRNCQLCITYKRNIISCSYNFPI